MTTTQIIGAIAIIFVIYAVAMIYAVKSSEKDNERKNKQ